MLDTNQLRLFSVPGQISCCVAQMFWTFLDTVEMMKRAVFGELRVYHILLLGQGGCGKTHIVQNLVFPIVQFIWPPRGRTR